MFLETGRMFWNVRPIHPRGPVIGVPAASPVDVLPEQA